MIQKKLDKYIFEISKFTAVTNQLTIPRIIPMIVRTKIFLIRIAKYTSRETMIKTKYASTHILATIFS